MAEGSKTDFTELALDGKNYLTWADDCQFHLEAMQLGKAIIRLGPNDIGLQLHEKAKAAIFLRRHIHPDLKMEYLEVKDPLILWTKLRERFGVQKHVIFHGRNRNRPHSASSTSRLWRLTTLPFIALSLSYVSVAR
jgi:hypothetical protein